jgi:outer membrane protein
MTNLLLAIVLLAQSAPMSLSDCIREALARHPDVDISKKDVEQAEARKTGAQAGYLPRLDLGTRDGYLFSGKTPGYSTVIGGYPFEVDEQVASYNDSHSFGLYLSQNIFDGGRMWKQVSRADKEIVRSQLGVVTTKEWVALGVITGFYELFKAERQLEVLKESLEVSRGQLNFAQERYKIGSASKVDVSKARVSVGEDRIAIERQQGVIESATVEVNLAMGRSPGDSLNVVEKTQDPGHDILKDTSTVSDSHASLKAMRQASEVAFLDVELAQSERWPKVTGSLSYQRQNSEFYKVYSRFDELYSISLFLNISFPIFDGFLTSANIEAAEVRTGRLKAETKKVRQELEARIVRAVKNLKRFRTIAAIEAENIVAAEQQLTLAKERYEVGEGTALEIRDAQLAVTRARLAKVQTEYDLKIAVARYHYAKGDLFDTYLSEEQL